MIALDKLGDTRDSGSLLEHFQTSYFVQVSTDADLDLAALWQIMAAFKQASPHYPGLSQETVLTPETRAADISRDDRAKYKKDVEGVKSNTTTHAQ